MGDPDTTPPPAARPNEVGSVFMRTSAVLLLLATIREPAAVPLFPRGKCLATAPPMWPPSTPVPNAHDVALRSDISPPFARYNATFAVPARLAAPRTPHRADTAGRKPPDIPPTSADIPSWRQLNFLHQPLRYIPYT